MFSSALKSFTSNISSNYTIASQPSSTAGPWKIFDAKKKSTGKAASVFVFEKKSLEPRSGSLGGRSNSSSLKKLHEEVLERLKKEASSLARLRHPSILELAEPVEETRSGGLMFATEPVTASLAGLLQEKDEQERSGGVGGRSSRYVVEEADGTKKRRELEIDELEIQKGLLQIGKGLEFLHESAGLVHSNLTPEAIFINAKSDWKISGLAFAGPGANSTTATSVAPISLSEVLNHDPRLPRSVQLNLDYTSPDFVLDNNVTSAADMFSLGILIIALYNAPHRSPLETNGSLSSYKRLFSSSPSVPTQNNNFMCSQPIPKDLVSGVLPRLITRRPAQRLSAREFQQAQYFDNILVSTIRFLDSLPAKTPNEKSQFMRGLPKILNQFPKSVLEKKVLPALLEEMKDKELLSLVLQNVFKIVSLTAGRRAFGEMVIPRIREIFLTSGVKGTPDRDSLKEAGLMVVLENMKIIAENTSGGEFKDHILPILGFALESPTHSLVDASLSTLPFVLPKLDFSTIKNELFPVIAAVFAKTSSMGIKIRGLEALQTLCGGGAMASSDDDLNGISSEPSKNKHSSSVILDKYTIQEKVVPLLKAIKTKEPAVMMASLEVFKQVGKIADSDFLAMEVLPVLWNFALGPLLNLQQFQSFMTLIKSLSARIEQEQTRKLQELSTTSTATASRADFMSFGGPVGQSNGFGAGSTTDDGDFESLVTGRKTSASNEGFDGGWDNGASSSTIMPLRPSNAGSAPQQRSQTPQFSWSTPTASPPPQSGGLKPSGPASRTITPDHNLSSFASLAPTSASSSFSQPLQPSQPLGMSAMQPSSPPAFSTSGQPSLNWSTTSNTSGLSSSSNIWASQSSPMAAPAQTPSAFSIAPPPKSPYSGFSIAPPPSNSMGSRQSSFGAAGTMSAPMGNSQMSSMGQRMGMGTPSMGSMAQNQTQPAAQGQAGQGLDKYESLL